MKIFDFFKREQSLEQKVLDKCGCVCYCPKCRNILNIDSGCEAINNDNAEYRYTCSKCQHISIWDFGTPVPWLVS